MLKTPKHEALGKRIFHARTKAKLTQQDLALAVGLSGDGARSYICRVEAGLQEPRIGTLRRIAHTCAVSLAELIG